MYRLCLAFVLVAFLAPYTNCYAQEDTDHVQFKGSYRLRFENLDNAFRANADGGDQLWASRLLVSAKANGERWFGEAELQDSRTWLDDRGTPLGADDVNTLEPLQLYAGWSDDVGIGELMAKAGRMTIDMGSRRFVARNGFRNTINAFTGIHAELKQSTWHWQVFYTFPVQRLPTQRSELDDNEAELDEDFSKVRFWAAHGTRQISAFTFESFVMGLQEDDRRNLNTANQNFYSLGARILKSPSAQQWDYEWEGVYQFGESRGSVAPTDTTNLDHRASFMHAHLGYQFADAWKSRISLQFDYASGDKNPNDRENNRFVTLFGARRFDFGPTGIYGPFIRGNIVTPSTRWEFSPAEKTKMLIDYRSAWLEEKRDGLTAAGLRDSSGNTDDFVGHQLEASVHINATTNLQLETGLAYLLKGPFLKDAPDAPDTGNTTYTYASANYRF